MASSIKPSVPPFRALSAVLFFVSAVPLASEELSLRVNAKTTAAVTQWLDNGLPGLVTTYKHLHANPELSFQETRTSALLAESLENCGYTVTQGLGKTGIVGVLKNGEGPTVLIRGDMDALPIIEKTDLPYASKVRIERANGSSSGVMHACGHDVHTSMLIGTGRLLAELRNQWTGTVVLLGQPAEEIGAGALAMINDGLFSENIAPMPDYCLALHVSADLPVGTVGYTPGWCHANVDSADITIYGRGGHGARPHQAVDPIVAAAQVITALQSIVSRRLDPVDSGVVTIGTIRGGTRRNVIADEVKMQLTIRTHTPEARRTLLDGIRQITTDTCKAMGCPKPPLVAIDENNYTPACFNDPGLSTAAAHLFRRVLGEGKVRELPAQMGGEDFGEFTRHLNVPALQFRVGTVSRERYEASKMPNGVPLPSLHSPLFHPEPDETLRTSIEAMANLALSLLDH